MAAQDKAFGSYFPDNDARPHHMHGQVQPNRHGGSKAAGSDAEEPIGANAYKHCHHAPYSSNKPPLAKKRQYSSISPSQEGTEHDGSSREQYSANCQH